MSAAGLPWAVLGAQLCIFLRVSQSTGLYNAPKGARFTTGARLLAKRAPVLGGSFALWALIFSMTDCSMIYLRKKDDPANAVIGGALTGYLLAFRGGQKVALKNAAIGGFILLAIEGFGIWTNLKAAKRANSAQLQLQEGTEKNSTVKRAMQTGRVNNVRLPYVNIDSQNVDFISNQAYRRHVIDSEKKGMMQGSEEL